MQEGGRGSADVRERRDGQVAFEKASEVVGIWCRRGGVEHAVFRVKFDMGFEEVEIPVVLHRVHECRDGLDWITSRMRDHHFKRKHSRRTVNLIQVRFSRDVEGADRAVKGNCVNPVQDVCADEDGENKRCCGKEEGELPGGGVDGERPAAGEAQEEV